MSAVLSPVLSSSRRSAGWIIPALTRAAGAPALAEGARLGEFEVVHLRETEARCEEVATCDPGSSAASLAAGAALAESPRSSATASASARWGEHRATRPFGQVSLVMSRPGRAPRSRVGAVAWMLGVLAGLLVGVRAAGLAAWPTEVPGAPSQGAVLQVGAPVVAAQSAAEVAPQPLVPAPSPVREEAAPQPLAGAASPVGGAPDPIAPASAPVRADAAAAGSSSPCTPKTTTRKLVPQRTRGRPVVGSRRDPPAIASPSILPGVLDPAEPRAAQEGPAPPVVPPEDDELMPVRVAPKGASEGLLVAPTEEPRSPAQDLLPT